MSKRPLILITNDDGISAPGIYSLWKALYEANKTDLVILAPLKEKSGSGAAISWEKPVMIKKVAWEKDTPAWAIDGTPADCVKMGLSVLLDRKPDFIFSGVNAGSNAGRNVLHSGTVGAVIEGIFREIPGVAFSCENGSTPNFSVAEKYIPTVFDYISHFPFPPGCFLNINFPQVAKDKVKGFKLTRQGQGRWIEVPELKLETSEESSYWFAGKPEERPEIEDSDIAWLKKGYMSAVPIHVHELTEFEELANRKLPFETFFLDNHSNA